MNRTETIKSIKESLKKLFSVEEKTFSDYVLSDGTKITSADADLQIGSQVYAVDDQGNQTPLDDGDYILGDGRTITVVGNAITEIAGVESTDAESPVEDADTSSDAPAMKMDDNAPVAPADEADLAQRVTDIEANIEEILTILQSLNTGSEQMMSAISKIGDEPGEEKVKVIKKGYEEYNTKKVSQRKNMSEIEELRSIILEKNKKNNNLNLN
jgi:hypothetical protein